MEKKINETYWSDKEINRIKKIFLEMMPKMYREFIPASKNPEFDNYAKDTPLRCQSWDDGSLYYVIEHWFHKKGCADNKNIEYIKMSVCKHLTNIGVKPEICYTLVLSVSLQTPKSFNMVDTIYVNDLWDNEVYFDHLWDVWYHVTK